MPPTFIVSAMPTGPALARVGAVALLARRPSGVVAGVGHADLADRHNHIRDHRQRG